MRLLRGESARERAIEVFAALRVWDTEHNNGVLIYLLLADRDVEIVADRGIHGRSASTRWEASLPRNGSGISRRTLRGRACWAVSRAFRVCWKPIFPGRRPDANELPDRPVVL